MLILPNQDGLSPPTSLPFKVRRHGWIARSPYHSTRGTHHGDAMLTLVVGGAGTYKRGNTSQPIRAGMIGLVLPSDVPGLLFADPENPYDHFFCRFSGYEALAIAERILDNHSHQAFFEYRRWRSLADAFQQLVNRHPGPDADDRLRPVDTMLAHILTLIEFPDDSQAAREVDADRLMRYMRERLSSPADLGNMARYFGISKEHLCRIAKPLLGTTILEKWVEMKLDWAMALLGDDSFAIKDVARLVGYDNAMYFSNVFRNHFGLSPSAYRNRLKDSERPLM